MEGGPDWGGLDVSTGGAVNLSTKGSWGWNCQATIQPNIMVSFNENQSNSIFWHPASQVAFGYFNSTHRNMQWIYCRFSVSLATEHFLWTWNLQVSLADEAAIKAAKFSGSEMEKWSIWAANACEVIYHTGNRRANEAPVMVWNARLIATTFPTCSHPQKLQRSNQCRKMCTLKLHNRISHDSHNQCIL